MLSLIVDFEIVHLKIFSSRFCQCLMISGFVKVAHNRIVKSTMTLLLETIFVCRVHPDCRHVYLLRTIFRKYLRLQIYSHRRKTILLPPVRLTPQSGGLPLGFTPSGHETPCPLIGSGHPSWKDRQASFRLYAGIQKMINKGYGFWDLSADRQASPE
jgi:hypothetical protein